MVAAELLTGELFTLPPPEEAERTTAVVRSVVETLRGRSEAERSRIGQPPR
jgi:hypothetical protein